MEIFAISIDFLVIYGIIDAEDVHKHIPKLRFLSMLALKLRILCIIDGFAKMPLQASIFASWLNIYTEHCKQSKFLNFTINY